MFVDKYIHTYISRNRIVKKRVKGGDRKRKRHSFIQRDKKRKRQSARDVCRQAHTYTTMRIQRHTTCAHIRGFHNMLFSKRYFRYR